MSATDPIGAERLAALLAGDAPRTPAEERRAALVADLRGGVLHAPEALRQRVLSPAPRPARRRLLRPALPSRRRALVLVPAVLALALLAAAVHGVVSPAPRPAVQSAESAARAKSAPALGVAAAPSPDAAAHGRSRPERMLDSAVGVLRLEGRLALAALGVLALAALGLALARARRRREERRLLGASPPAGRGDLME